MLNLICVKLTAGENYNSMNDTGMEKIIIFGLGRDFKRFRKILVKSYQIIACTDNTYIPEENYWKAKYIKPEKIVEYTYDKIIICSTGYGHEIRQQLREKYAIEEEKIIEIKNMSEYWECIEREKEANKKSVLEILNRKETILCIGDSHVYFFGGDKDEISFIHSEEGVNYYRGAISPFVPLHLGPALAYNFFKENTFCGTKEKILHLQKINFITENIPVLCVVGEIDIRVHVFRQAEKKKVSYKAIIDEIVFRYLESVTKAFGNREIYIWGPIATQSDKCAKDKDFPRYATEIERNKATEYFNQILERECFKRNFRFISIFKKLIDNNYKTKLEYYEDAVHLSSKAWELAESEFLKMGIGVKRRKEDEKLEPDE